MCVEQSREEDRQPPRGELDHLRNTSSEAARQAAAAPERQGADDAPRASFEEFKTIADQVADAVWATRFDGIEGLTPEKLAAMDRDQAAAFLGRLRFTFVSPSAETLFGYPLEEIYQLRVKDLLTEESALRLGELVVKELAIALADPSHANVRGPVQLQHVRSDGGTWWGELTSRFFRDSQGRIVGSLGITRDVTTQREATEVLREEHNRLRLLLENHERERRLVAYEIHDGLVQPMTAALMHLESHLRQPAEAADSGQIAVRLLRDSIASARALIRGLRPAVLDEFGVVVAIEQLVAEAEENSGAEIEFHREVCFERLPHQVENTAFRIVQESLANALRHGRTKKVRIALVQRQEELSIQVEDWGIGFDLEAVEDGRFGLEGIRQRARLFDGEAEIDSAPGKGTRVCVRLPLPDRELQE